MPFFQRIRNKLVLAFLLVSLIPAFAIGLYSVRSSAKSLMDKELNNQLKDIKSISNEVGSFLSSTKADILFLSQSPVMQKLLSKQHKEDKEYEILRKDLEKEFFSFSEARRTYYQIRFLDENGQEIVRIDSDGMNKNSDQANSIIVPKDKLQNKKNRYYFKDSITLLPNEVFVSPLDLNREHGKVEVPHKPVIRYATPLFYPGTNKRAGIIITNVDANAFLGKLKDVQLVGEDGTYFHNKDKTKLWGGKRDLNTGANFKKDVPLVADQILKLQSGALSSSGENLISFDKSTLSFSSNSSVFGALTHLNDKLMTFERLDVPGATPAQSWVFVKPEPISNLLSSVISFLKTFALIMLAVVTFAFILAFVIGTAITKPIRYLTEMAEKVSLGELDKPISVNDKGEIGHLAAAFERMRVSMLKSMGRLRKLKAVA